MRCPRQQINSDGNVMNPLFAQKTEMAELFDSYVLQIVMCIIWDKVVVEKRKGQQISNHIPTLFGVRFVQKNILYFSPLYFSQLVLTVFFRFFQYSRLFSR